MDSAMVLGVILFKMGISMKVNTRIIRLVGLVFSILLKEIIWLLCIRKVVPME